MTDVGQSVPVWIITDSARRVAQARRLDGEPWQGIDAKAKSLVTNSGDTAWPVGAADIGSNPFVALAEGGPDFLAAWHFLWLCGRVKEAAPVTMLGAGLRIHADALPFFADKGVWLFPHNDEGVGAKAAARWTKQLRAAGAAWVKPFDFAPYTLPDGRQVKDLNDLATCRGFGLGDEEEETVHV